ncbi:hypothetical protein CPC08DRAFT_728570 [Agrocybe pediades]|nr:hypothetical protein CPC08DRAFT_728570 [Agrocybe pediades]
MFRRVSESGTHLANCNVLLTLVALENVHHSWASSTNANILERPAASDTNKYFTASLSEMTRTSAVLAGMAFAIATSLVGLSAYGVACGTKMGLGGDDARQFGLRMRSILSMSTQNNILNISPDRQSDVQPLFQPNQGVSATMWIFSIGRW